VKRRRGISSRQKKRMKAKWISRILCRNCLLRHVIEGNVEGGKEVMGRRRRRRKQLPDDREEKERIL